MPIALIPKPQLYLGTAARCLYRPCNGISRNRVSWVGHLISWLLWCDLQGKHAVRQPIINNFSSVQLMQVAGYQWPTEASLYGWLQSWGHVVGRSGLQKLLAEQGVANQTRFLPVLDGLR